MQIVQENNTMKIAPEKDLISPNVTAIRSELVEKTNNLQSGLVVFDLTQIKQIDSSGVGIVVGLYKVCQEKNAQYEVLVKTSSMPHRVLKQCNLGSLFTIREDETNG